MLSRALSRERELAVRAALGASRSDILSTLLAEGAVFGAVAGILGLAIAEAGVRLISGLMRLETPLWITIGLSWRVFAFATMVSIAAGIAAALLPAWRFSQGSVTDALKEGGRSGGEGRRRQRARSALVVSEMAFAVILLVGAGLLVRSFRAITRVQPGFDADSVLTFRVELGWRAYPDLATRRRFQHAMLDRLAALPGVSSVGMVDNLPLGGRPTIDDAILLEGQTAEAQRANPFVNRRTASAGFFETFRIPLVQGRAFTTQDRDSSRRVALVSQALAARMWPASDAIGKRIRLSSSDFRVLQNDSADALWIDVVGVVGDVRHSALTSAPALDVYVPFDQWNNGSLYFVLRTERDPMTLARIAPEHVLSVDPNQSYFDVRTMQERVRDRTWVPRLSGALFTAFGALAALLAVIGMYAVLAFRVAQRKHELSVRQALGATPASLSRLVVLDGMRLAVAGAAIGLAGALVLARTVSRLLYDVSPSDPVTFALVPTLLLAVCACGCALPAWRVTRIEALEAMRGASL
jgi:putative ABC transport system permease protein